MCGSHVCCAGKVLTAIFCDSLCLPLSPSLKRHAPCWHVRAVEKKTVKLELPLPKSLTFVRPVSSRDVFSEIALSVSLASWPHDVMPGTDSIMMCH